MLLLLLLPLLLLLIINVGEPVASSPANQRWTPYWLSASCRKYTTDLTAVCLGIKAAFDSVDRHWKPLRSHGVLDLLLDHIVGLPPS